MGVTKISEEQSYLHWMMLILCTVIFVAVFSVMFYSIWKHRKSVGHKAANFHESWSWKSSGPSCPSSS